MLNNNQTIHQNNIIGLEHYKCVKAIANFGVRKFHDFREFHNWDKLKIHYVNISYLRVYLWALRLYHPEALLYSLRRIWRLKGGTISMPTGRFVDNDFIPRLMFSRFSCSFCKVIISLLYLRPKIQYILYLLNTLVILKWYEIFFIFQRANQLNVVLQHLASNYTFPNYKLYYIVNPVNEGKN